MPASPLTAASPPSGAARADASPVTTPRRPRASGELAFDPLSLRLSLVYATLRFRLGLTAVTEIPPAHLLGDMISAHGSLGRDAQLTPAIDAFARIAAIPRMAPGQSVTLSGELQLPLSAIRPVREGAGSFMIPLVRFAFLDDDEHAQAEHTLPRLDLGCVFALGLPGDGRGLAPIRIDTGPREVSGLAANEIEAGRRRSLVPGATLAA